MDRDFDDRVYRTIGVDRLIVFAMQAVTAAGEECTFERLVKECFTLFPHSFSLYRYPEWPDSNKLDRPLRTLRQKGLVTGDPKTGFNLTKFGQRVAIEVESQLKGTTIPTEIRRTQLKGRERILMNYLKESDVYSRFARNKGEFSVTEAEFRGLLRCTLETPLRVVKQNLALYKRTAMECKETDVLEFLTACETRVHVDNGPR